MSVLFTLVSLVHHTLPGRQSLFSICGIYTSMSKVTGDDRNGGSRNIKHKMGIGINVKVGEVVNM